MKNPVPGRKQSTVHNPRPLCVQTCTQSHDKHTFLTVQASELAYMSLYIIYLYLVKNKLHNSTNLETCFFKLKMTKKRGKKAIKQIVFEYSVWEGGVYTKIKEWGSWGWEIQNQPVPPPSDINSFLPSARKKEGERDKKKKKTIQENIHSFRKQFYVTYKWKKKKGGGVGRGDNTIQIPKNQYFTIKLRSSLSF